MAPRLVKDDLMIDLDLLNRSEILTPAFILAKEVNKPIVRRSTLFYSDGIKRTGQFDTNGLFLHQKKNPDSL